MLQQLSAAPMLDVVSLYLLALCVCLVQLINC